MATGAIGNFLRVMRMRLTCKQIVCFFKLRFLRINCISDRVEDL